MDAGTGWCVGCARSIDEIAAWGGSDDAARRIVLARLPQRRRQLLELGVWAGPALNSEETLG
jgi:predicted Fe-S protein YdhL (DUF1289 family)